MNWGRDKVAQGTNNSGESSCLPFGEKATCSLSIFSEIEDVLKFITSTHNDILQLELMAIMSIQR